MCLYCFASLQNSVHTRLMHPCIACPSRRPDYLHFHKHRQSRTIPRPAPHLAYERSVGFASLQNSGRSISGILARPLPKGAGLRQGSLVSNTTIIRDTRNVQISQTLSAVKTEGSPAPNLSAFAITSANNPSVTTPKNSVLYQYIFNLILTAIPKMLYRTVTAPFTQGSRGVTSNLQVALNLKPL